MPAQQRLPYLATVVLGLLLPDAEREEVVADIADEYGARRRRDGRRPAGMWLTRQVAGSVPALVRRSWWRGWTGFEPRSSGIRSGGFSMESWIMDLRYAARRLRSRPTYSLLAVLTLALGVGGTAATFSIVRGLLVEPLPYRAEGEIGVFYFDGSWNEQEFLGMRGEFPGFQQVAAYRPDDVTLEVPNAPTRLLPAIATSAEIFSVLGTAPLIGPGFKQGDDLAGAEPVAIISHDLWQELGGDRSVVGERIRLDGVERTVVGVMPRGFWFPNPTVRAWMPAPMNPANRSGRYTLVGRVAPGVALDNLAPSLALLTKTLGERYTYGNPQWDKTKNPAVTPVREFLTGSLRPALLATLTAMGLILLIACANVAALMLGQVEGRSAELAVRSALGADRRRLTQQLVAEALLVGVLSAAAGAALAVAGFNMLVGALPLGAWADSAAVDWTLFSAAIGIAILAALLITIIPAVSLWRGDLRGALTRVRTSAGGRGGRMEGGLVVAEVALAVLMAAGAGLLIRSVTKLYAIDPGVETEGIAVLHVALGADVAGPVRRQRIIEMTTALGAMPGVEMASATQKLPLGGSGDNWGMAVEGQPELEPSTTAYRMVTPEYLQTLGIPLRDGRYFTDADRSSQEPVVIVNQALVDKYFPGVQPVGRRVGTGFGGWARIIGVVGNAAETTLTDEMPPARYMLTDQVPFTAEGQTLLIRTSRAEDATSIIESARSTLRRIAPDMAIREATTMDRVFAAAVGPVRQIMSLLSLLTFLALVLGAIGVYGVISHFVHRRRRDWGIRIALGLTPSKVIGQVVGRGTMLVAVGVIIGIAAALASAKLLGSLLYGVGATDPLALAGATTTLLLVGVLAAYIPAWRASRVDPASTLREQ